EPHSFFKAALQKITGGFRHGMFSHCIEEHLRKVIHYQMLYTAGLPWPPESLRVRYWSTDKKQQARNRQIYHGLRRGSLALINKLMGAAIEAAAEPDALKVARLPSAKNFLLKYSGRMALAYSVVSCHGCCSTSAAYRLQGLPLATGASSGRPG